MARTWDRGGRVSGITAPLAHGPFRSLALGRVLMLFGNGMAQVAMAFAVLDVTGSPSQVGLVVGARSVANVSLLLLGGVIEDRLPRPLVLRGACALGRFAGAAGHARGGGGGGAGCAGVAAGVKLGRTGLSRGCRGGRGPGR